MIELSDSDFALDAIVVVTVVHLERIENTVEEQIGDCLDSYCEYCCRGTAPEEIGARGDYSRQWHNSHPKKNQNYRLAALELETHCLVNAAEMSPLSSFVVA